MTNPEYVSHPEARCLSHSCPHEPAWIDFVELGSGCLFPSHGICQEHPDKQSLRGGGRYWWKAALGQLHGGFPSIKIIESPGSFFEKLSLCLKGFWSKNLSRVSGITGLQIDSAVVVFLSKQDWRIESPGT
jgi:hypothetical protein